MKRKADIASETPFEKIASLQQQKLEKKLDYLEKMNINDEETGRKTRTVLAIGMIVAFACLAFVYLTVHEPQDMLTSVIVVCLIAFIGVASVASFFKQE